MTASRSPSIEILCTALYHTQHPVNNLRVKIPFFRSKLQDHGSLLAFPSSLQRRKFPKPLLIVNNGLQRSVSTGITV